ncbi:hypothetical protein LINPERPRIM_LOCUS32941 [Linum perenne]
MSVLEEC